MSVCPRNWWPAQSGRRVAALDPGAIWRDLGCCFRLLVLPCPLLLSRWFSCTGISIFDGSSAQLNTCEEKVKRLLVVNQLSRPAKLARVLSSGPMQIDRAAVSLGE